MSPVGDGHCREVPDEGLQSERTYLAWQRTGLSFAALGALLVHVAGGFGRPLATVPGLFGLAVGAAILAWANVGYRRSHAAARGVRGAAVPRVVAAVSAATVVLCACGLILLTSGW